MCVLIVRQRQGEGADKTHDAACTLLERAGG
jgi:hypothetical protein